MIIPVGEIELKLEVIKNHRQHICREVTSE